MYMEKYATGLRFLRLPEERLYAITLKEIIREQEIQPLNKDEFHKTEVWIEPPKKTNSERKSNVIKARKNA